MELPNRIELSDYVITIVLYNFFFLYSICTAINIGPLLLQQ